MRTKLKFWPIVSGIILIVFFVILAIKFSDLEKFYKTLQQGIWYYIFALFTFETLYLVDQAEIFTGLFKIYNVNITIRKILKVFLAANFTNLALPSAGIAGLTVFSQAGPKLFNIKRSKAMVINLLYYFLNYGSFIVLMILGIILLFTMNKLQTYHYISASLMFILVLTGSSIFWVGYKNKNHLKNLLEGVAKFINFFSQRLSKKDLIKKDNINNLQTEIFYTTSVYKRNKHKFLEPLAFALLGHFIQIFVLYISFLAFGYNPEFYIVIIGYIFSVVFIMVSPTPSGIGIVEPVMAVTMASLGAPIEIATIATLTFRGITFWLPFFIGFYATRRLKLE